MSLPLSLGAGVPLFGVLWPKSGPKCLWKPLLTVTILRWEGDDMDFPTFSQNLRGAFQRETGWLQCELFFLLTYQGGVNWGWTPSSGNFIPFLYWIPGRFLKPQITQCYFIKCNVNPPLFGWKVENQRRRWLPIPLATSHTAWKQHGLKTISIEFSLIFSKACVSWHLKVIYTLRQCCWPFAGAFGGVCPCCEHSSFEVSVSYIYPQPCSSKFTGLLVSSVWLWTWILLCIKIWVPHLTKNKSIIDIVERRWDWPESTRLWHPILLLSSGIWGHPWASILYGKRK